MACVGDVLGEKYRIVKEIGRGGMAIVYLVWDIRLDKRWAVKEMINEDAICGRRQKCFDAETDVIKNCDHPALPRIVDILYRDDSTFIVMDYIEGVALNDLLKKEGPQDCRIVVEWMKSLADVLMYLHGLNPPIIYLDLKPSNIILKEDGGIGLIDFGISERMFDREEKPGYVMGTVGYASPEQMGCYAEYKEGYIDKRSDIYSFGATMYTLITGKILLDNCKNTDLYEKTIPDGVRNIISKCIQYRREDRYGSFDEVYDDLCNYEKSDRKYRGVCIRKICVCFSYVLMSVFFAFASYYGYRGIKNIKDEQYENALTMAYEKVINGQYEKAIEEYTYAICEVDGNRSDAYIEMLRLYTDYIDERMDGISKVSYYIEKEHEKGLEKAELFMKVGLECFGVDGKYDKSIYYFEQAEKEGYQNAEIYLNIAKSLSGLKVDYKKLSDNFEVFEKETEGLNDLEKRLNNYVLICDVLLRYGENVEDGVEKLVRYAGEGLRFLGENREEIVNAEYYVSFYQGMLSGYETLGDKCVDSDTERGMKYYSDAYIYCEKLLEMVSNDERVIMGSSKAYEYRKAKLYKKAELLAKLLKYDEACSVYELAENEYGRDAKIFYVGHLSLLCELEEKKNVEVEKWDKEKLCELYKKGNELDGINDDYRWKRISVKLMPIIQELGG